LSIKIIYIKIKAKKLKKTKKLNKIRKVNKFYMITTNVKQIILPLIMEENNGLEKKREFLLMIA
jgi:hypothetical protein